MKKLLAMLCILSSFTSFAGVNKGQKAPDFSLQSHLGENVQLSSLKGQYVVLEWYNKGCPFVRKHYDSKNMQTLQQTYTQKGVKWLTIVSSAAGKQGYLANTSDMVQTRKMEKMASSFLLRDPSGKVGQSYQAKTTPHMYIINPEGILIYQGAIDDTPSTDPEDIKRSKNYIKFVLDKALNGETIKPITTKPYGCSVKY